MSAQEDSGDLVLAKIDQARVALAEAKTILETKQIADVAEAARAYLRRIGATTETINNAIEIRLRAERRMGQMMQQAPKNPGVRVQPQKPGTAKGSGGSISDPPLEIPSLEKLGIKKRDADQARTLAGVTDSTFETKLGEHKRSGVISMNKLFNDLKSPATESDAKSQTDIPLPKSAPTRSTTREEAMAKVPPELRDEVLKEARQRRPGVSTATTIDVPTAASIDHANRSVQAAHASKAPAGSQPFDRDRIIRRLYATVHNTTDYQPIKEALLQNTWKLSDRELTALNMLPDSRLQIYLPCQLHHSLARQTNIALGEEKLHEHH